MGKYGKTYHYSDGLSLAVEAQDGPWVIRWTDQGTGKSKRRSTGTTDRAEAEAVLMAFAQRRLHESEATARQVVTCGDVLEGYERFLREHGKHRSNLDLIRKLMRFWRDVPINEVNNVTQKRYEAERRQGLHSLNQITSKALKRRGGQVADSTLAREMTTLNGAGTWAVKAGMIPATQQFKLIILPDSVRRPVALSQRQVDDLMALAAETSVGRTRLTRIHRFVWLACVTGARCEALETMRWSQVDFDTGLIDFHDDTRHSTKKQRPLQPISARILPLLQQAHAERINDLVLDGGTIEGAWRAFRNASPYAGTDLRRHDLRAAAITIALTKGMPVAKASLFFKVTVGVIERHYLRPGPDFLSDVHAFI